MNPNLNFLILSATITLTFALPHEIYSMEDSSRFEEQKITSEIHLPEEVDDRKEVGQQSIIRQETEQIYREKQENIYLWNFGIDKSIQHIKDLQNDDLSCGELMRVLEAMKKCYTTEELIKLKTSSVLCEHETSPTGDLAGMVEHMWSKGACAVLLTDLWNLSHLPYIGHLTRERIDYEKRLAIEEVKTLTAKYMDNYKDIQGTIHPRWIEFSNM